MSNTKEAVKTSVKYVVKRDHHRVSDLVYDTKDQAKEEFEHWTRITNRSNDGTKVTVQEFEPRV